MEKEAAKKAIAELEKALERTDLTEEERSDIREEIGCIGMSAVVTGLLNDEIELPHCEKLRKTSFPMVEKSNIPTQPGSESTLENADPSQPDNVTQDDLLNIYAEFLAHENDGNTPNCWRERWLIYSKAFGITFGDEDIERLHLQKRIELPKIYLDLLRATAAAWKDKIFDPVGSGLEAPRPYHNLVMPPHYRLQRLEITRSKLLRKLMQRTFKKLYGKKAVSFSALKDLGIDKFPEPQKPSVWDDMD